MGVITLVIVAGSVVGACAALIGLLRIYNERPLWTDGPAGQRAMKAAATTAQARRQ
jgi:hypothetical protein